MSLKNGEFGKRLRNFVSESFQDVFAEKTLLHYCCQFKTQVIFITYELTVGFLQKKK